MKKKKILKVILLVILILVVIFLVCTVRKMLIIKNLNEKVSQYVKSDNYYEKITNNMGTITEYYCKGDNAVVFMNHNTQEGKTRKLANYFKGEQCNTYIESPEDNVAILNSNGVPSKIMILSSFDTDNDLWILFLMSARANIKNGEYNNKECYIIAIDKYNEVYIEKDTGLRIKAREGTTKDETGKEIPLEMEYYYEFNNVNDEIFTEPDISQYTIQENN